MKKLFGNMLIASIALFCLPSCLKDKLGISMADTPGTRIVELAPIDDGITSSIDSRVNTITIEFKDKKADDTITIAVYMADAAGPLNKDVVVTLARDSDAITKYNLANATNYSFLPNNYIISENLQVTIPAGQNVGYLKVRINDISLYGYNYMLAYQIVSVPAPLSISIDRFYVYYKLAARNKYDGSYTSSSATCGLLDYEYSNLGPISSTIDLVTVDDSTCILRDSYMYNNGYTDPYGNPLNAHLFWVSNGNNSYFSWYYYFCPVLHFSSNGSGKIVAVTNYFGQPEPAQGRYALLSPDPTQAAASLWDPSTRNVVANYLMYGNSFTGGWAGCQTWFHDVLTFVSERP
jgi:uncharacterized protein DUF1735